jgi:hypothetical protein
MFSPKSMSNLGRLTVTLMYRYSVLPLLCLSSPGLIRLTMISEALVSVSECVERSIQCPGQRGSRLLVKRKQIQLFTIKERPREIFDPLFFSESALCTRTVLFASSTINLTL